jgi:queuine tRNA-ribosyltransferase
LNDFKPACEVVLLPNGVRAMKDLRTGHVMHCGTGPAVEPYEIYVNPSKLGERLLLKSQYPLVLFDVGLGAASNAAAAWRVSESAALSSRRLEMVSFDCDILALEHALRPENLDAFGFGHADFVKAARGLICNGYYETPRSSWRLALGNFPDCLAKESANADIVFWDMYSAATCPALWTVEMFTALRAACNDGATLHTTNTATSARTAMLLGGFAVGVSCGTGRSTETTVACTSHLTLENPLDARWLQRLARSSAPFPSDVKNRILALQMVQSHLQFRV